MAKRKKKDELEEPIVDLGQVSGQATDLFERYQNVILGVVGGIALLVIGYFAYQNFYQGPRELRAVTQLHKAEFAFAQDSFQKALTDPGGGYPNLVDVADQYSGTKAGNLAKYYAGTSFLHMGNFEFAIRYLKQYSAKDDFTRAMKNGMLGDAYSELNKFNDAVSYYKKAASASGDDVTAPINLKKAGMLLEKQGKMKEALAQYKKIQDKYYNTDIGRTIDKYIARVGG